MTPPVGDAPEGPGADGFRMLAGRHRIVLVWK